MTAQLGHICITSACSYERSLKLVYHLNGLAYGSQSECNSTGFL